MDKVTRKLTILSLYQVTAILTDTKTARVGLPASGRKDPT
mgnify:CR=1 FL=1